MPLFTDQTGHSFELSQVPHRIVSLVPSLTLLLADLGLDHHVAGITKFCIHPDKWFRTKTRVGGTKQIKMDIIHQIQPDLIIANKEENIKEQVEALAQQYPVYISDINTLEDAYKAIEDIGQMTGSLQAASNIIGQIKKEFGQLDPVMRRIKVCYLIWNDPSMTIGHDTFIHHLLEQGGFDNVFADRTRYPEVSLEEIKNSGCEALFLSSEPYPFGPKHEAHWKELLPGVNVVLVDGEQFSWYGSKLIQSPAYFRKIREEYIDKRV